MQVKVQHRQDYSVAHLNGELDHHSASFVRSELDKAIREHKDANLVLDLKNLRFMDSSGLGVILGRYKQLKKHGNSMYIRNANKQIEKVFSVSGLYSIVKKIK